MIGYQHSVYPVVNRKLDVFRRVDWTTVSEMRESPLRTSFKPDLKLCMLP